MSIKIYSIRVTSDGLGGGETFGVPDSAWEWDGSTGDGVTFYADSMTLISGGEGTQDMLHAQNSEFFNDIEVIYPMIVTDFVNIEETVSGTFDITVEVIYEGPSNANVAIGFTSPP